MSSPNRQEGNRLNRQESHRIYLQLFTPQSTSSSPSQPQLNRHDSHQIHPPNYPMTSPGAPYRFSSSSSSFDSQTSYSFSSHLSSAHPAVGGGTTNNAKSPNKGGGPSSHNPAAASSSAATADSNKKSIRRNRYIQQPSTITTSAAVRLTDRALARDVTALLRGKFGLPQISVDEGQQQHNQNEREYSFGQSLTTTFSRRLSPSGSMKKERSTSGSGGSGAFSSLDNHYHEQQHHRPTVMDALVLVGTLEGPPKGYVSFEHEEEFVLSEHARLSLARELSYRQLQQQRQQQQLGTLNEEKSQELNTDINATTLRVSESSATVRASGNANRYFDASSSSSLAISPSKSNDGMLDLSSSRDSMMGLDLSSSQYNSARAAGGGNGVGNEWSVGVGGTILEDDTKDEAGAGGGKKKLTTLFSELSLASPGGNVNATTANGSVHVNNVDISSMQYEPDFEPIHLIRTVNPDEHPLQVRDEMMKSLTRLRKRAEDEMGLGLYPNANISSPGKGRRQLQQQKKPHLTFRWYFQPCSPLGGIDASASSSQKIQSIPAYIDVEGYCTDDDDDDDESSNNRSREGFDDEYDDVSDDNGNGNDSSTLICQLNKEKRRVAMLREQSDSPFIVSGYLLKQSQKDPNVWKRMYCVLSDDRLWVIGRVRPLIDSSDRDVRVGSSSNHEVMSSLRVGSHCYINLHRSILIEREEPLNHRLPNTFRLVTSLGKTHSFRAFNSHSFHSWTTALSEKIAQTHTWGMLDLAHVITEEETLARCRRMEDTVVSPFLNNMMPSSSKDIPPISMDIVRFGISVAEYRELCRKVNEAMQCYKNSGGVVNVQTRVGSSPNSKANRTSSSLSASSRARNEAMVSSVWEDARVVASKSAQLLHAIASSQHSILEAGSRDNEDCDAANDEEEKIGSLEVNSHSMKHLIDEQKDIQTLLSKRWKHQVTPEGESDDEKLDHLPPLKLFDNLLNNFTTCITSV